MKIGAIADVHGNWHAFRPLSDKLLSEKLDMTLFCGDVCGYYYQQNEVVERLESMPNIVAICGNHDRMFLDACEDPSKLERYTNKYGRSFVELKSSMTPETLDFLRGLSDRYEDKKLGIAAYHGSPWDILNGYVYPTDPIDRFAELPYRFVVLGQTHYPMHRTSGVVHVVNPGSCGQPRNSRPPSYAVIDTDTAEVRFEYVPYDPAPLISDIRQRKESNAYLETVLTR